MWLVARVEDNRQIAEMLDDHRLSPTSSPWLINVQSTDIYAEVLTVDPLMLELDAPPVPEPPEAQH